MKDRSSATLRHIPKQPRGERTVDQILASAEAVFSEVGYEHASTNAVAARAGVSIGSLYQFFSGKDAILDTMAQRYLEVTRKEMLVLLQPKNGFFLRETLSGLLDKILALQEQRPFFLQFLSIGTYEVVQESVRKQNEEMTDLIATLLAHNGMKGSTADIKLRAAFSVQAASALLPSVLAAKGQERRKAKDEILTLLERYLQPELNGSKK